MKRAGYDDPELAAFLSALPDGVARSRDSRRINSYASLIIETYTRRISLAQMEAIMADTNDLGTPLDMTAARIQQLAEFCPASGERNESAPARSVITRGSREACWRTARLLCVSARVQGNGYRGGRVAESCRQNNAPLGRRARAIRPNETFLGRPTRI